MGKIKIFSFQTLFYLSTFILFTSCQQDVDTKDATSFVLDTISSQKKVEASAEVIKEYPTFARTTCIERIRTKIKDKKALVIHAFVPLCDNDNQGIVKVNKRLGDGMNLNTNLYWGSKYGLKNHFKTKGGWKLLEAQKAINDNVLERLVFYKTYPNFAKVYLVADAYRGDRMKECLLDFFDAISGRENQEIKIKGQTIGIKGQADFQLFNGHNGLMDYDIDYVDNTDDRIREVSVIGCISHSYFNDHLKHAKAYPLLMTTNLMAPEAYVMEAVIDSWAMQKKEPTFKKAAGKAYDKYQHCGLKGATRLFKSGW